MMPVVKGDRESKSRSTLFFNLIKFNHRPQADRYKVGRGRSIHDNVSGGEIWVINDEDPDKIGLGFETCAVLHLSPKGSWSVIEVDEGFKSSDKWLQDLVDEYNREKNLVELQELIEQQQLADS